MDLVVQVVEQLVIETFLVLVVHVIAHVVPLHPSHADVGFQVLLLQ